MGCAFDMYSQAWIDRAYGILLFIYCWFAPILVIFSSYFGIIYHVHKNNKIINVAKSSGGDGDNINSNREDESINNPAFNPQSYCHRQVCREWIIADTKLTIHSLKHYTKFSLYLTAFALSKTYATHNFRQNSNQR